MPGDRMGCRTALVVEPAAKWPVRCRRTRRRIGAGDTSHREGSVMRLGILVLALVAPIACMAKSETARIEIAQGKRALVTLGPESASQFTIWTGPGTSSTDSNTTDSPRDFADWSSGAVEPPAKLRVYKVRFYCAALGEFERETIPSNLCYGVRYGVDPDTGQGYIQIPKEGDRDFPKNTQTILRGVEGRWFRASDRWEEVVRPQIDAVHSADAARNAWQNQYQQPYSTPPPP